MKTHGYFRLENLLMFRLFCKEKQRQQKILILVWLRVFYKAFRKRRGYA